MPDQQLFLLTTFIPWAAYIQMESGEGYTQEQDELYDILKDQARTTRTR